VVQLISSQGTSKENSGKISIRTGESLDQSGEIQIQPGSGQTGGSVYSKLVKQLKVNRVRF